MDHVVRKEQALLVLKGLEISDDPTGVVLSLLEDGDYEVRLATLAVLGGLLRGRELSGIQFDFTRLKEKLADLVLSDNVYYQVAQESAKHLVDMDDVPWMVERKDFAEIVLKKVVETEGKPHLAEAFLPLLGLLLGQVRYSDGDAFLRWWIK